MIRPIALYNSKNLAHFTRHQIESLKGNKVTLLSYMNNTSYTSKLHHRFLKYILGVKRNCNNLATLGELGELPATCTCHNFTIVILAQDVTDAREFVG